MDTAIAIDLAEINPYYQHDELAAIMPAFGFTASATSVYREKRSDWIVFLALLVWILFMPVITVIVIGAMLLFAIMNCLACCFPIGFFIMSDD